MERLTKLSGQRYFWLFVILVPACVYGATDGDIYVSSISTVVVGNSVTINYTVTNTGSVSHNFGVGCEIRQGSTVKADLGGQWTGTISPGNGKSGSFTYTIPTNWSAGTYTARAAVWTGWPGSSTWLDSYDRNFSAEAQTTDADITSVSVSPDPVVAGSSITVNYTVKNTGNYTRSFNIGCEIRQGSTVKADLGCKTTSTISPGSSTSGSFTYTVPSGWSGGTYTSRCIAWSGSCGTGHLDYRDDNFVVEAQTTDADVTSVSVSPDPVVAGSSITVNYTVKNTGNYSRSFSMGCEIRQGDNVLADVGCFNTPVLSVGQTYSGSSFTYTIPSGWSGGTYTARCIAWSGGCGTGWLDNDDDNFTVQAQPLSLNGRIAYHSYTTYNSMDGILRICEMPEQNYYNVPEVIAETNHQMNPHFSPDGSLVTFMAVPTGSPASPGAFRSYLEVYLHDFTTSTVLRLTDNSIADEDPKFSPDGTKIVFKRNGNIHTMDIDGTNVQPLTDTAIEESGPRYSPSALGKIAYWVTYYDGGYKNERIWWMDTDGSSQQQLVPDSDVRIMYYPVFVDSERLAYTRWHTNADELDQIHIYNLSSPMDDPVSFRDETANDSDAFPIEGNRLGFSSTRAIPGAKGGYDLYIGDLQTGHTWPLSLASTNIDDLGGCYTSVSMPPSTRTVTVESSPSGASFTISGVGSNEFEYTGATPWSNSNMQPGHYTVIWDDLSGYNTPPPDTQYLVSNGISFPGNYIPLTPVISVTPASWDFGSVDVGSYADLGFTVENTGGGTLTGEASVPAPFNIISGGSYSLGSSQTQIVTVRFSPPDGQSYSEDVTFTGGGGATRPVTGEGVLPTYTISGTTGIDGVVMDGLPGNPVTSGGGVYNVTVDYGWSSSVTPTKEGYIFDPPSRTYSNVTADHNAENYTGTILTFVISGTITSGGSGLGGVTMNSIPGNPVTAADGSYSGAVEYGWSGTVTPTKEGYTLDPPSRTYSNVTADQVEQDYRAYLGPDWVSWLCDNQDRFTTGLVESQVGFSDHRAFTYDQAVAAIAFTRRGNLERTRGILDGMEALQALPEGYWRSAYRADTGAVWGWDIGTGPVAWMVMAINYYESEAEDDSYAVMAEKAISWLENRIDNDPCSGSYGALNLGENIPDIPNPEKVYSTEHQFDAYSAFRNRAVLTENHTLKNRLYSEADAILAYLVREPWKDDHFERGYNDPETWLDCQSWAAMALGTTGPGGEDFVSALDYAYENMRRVMDYNSSITDVNGFSYNDYQDTVWIEGTLEMADAYLLFGDAGKGTYYLSEMARTVRDDGGLSYSFDESGTPEGNWPLNLRYSSVSSVGWYYFAQMSFNPFVIETDVSDHVFGIETYTGWDYGEANVADDLRYEFYFGIETDATVNLVEVNRPGDYNFVIPNDVNTQSGNVETWHYVEEGIHCWEYEAGFSDVSELDDYGDGNYVITVRYVGGGQGETTVLFGDPCTGDPIGQPTEEPVMTLPAHNGSASSPVTFMWEDCNDGNATSVWLGLEREDESEQTEMVLPADANRSDPCALSSGTWEATLSFDNWHDFNNADGIAVQAGKYSESQCTFEVLGPALSYIQIIGPEEVAEGFCADYNCIAYYSDDSNEDVSCDVNWAVDPNYASIDSNCGRLRAKNVKSDQVCQVTAAYEGMTTAYDITIKNQKLIITSPRGGKTYLRGKKYYIRWKRKKIPGKWVKIELYDGCESVVIAHKTRNDGKRGWRISREREPGSDYKIVITSHKNGARFLSKGRFRIKIPVINVIRPDGGESWVRGRRYYIRWKDKKIFGKKVMIELYKDDDPNSIITSSTDNDGKKRWRIPADQELGSDYKIKISSRQDPSIYGFSKDYFTITGP